MLFGKEINNTLATFIEEEIGQAIREAIDDGIIKREDIFVTTKIYPSDEMENPEESI